jgi:hypothetical protein
MTKHPKSEAGKSAKIKEGGMTFVASNTDFLVYVLRKGRTTLLPVYCSLALWLTVEIPTKARSAVLKVGEFSSAGTSGLGVGLWKEKKRCKRQ